MDPSPASEAKLFSKLRAVEFEIDAVASTVNQGRKGSEEDSNDGNDGEEQGDVGDSPEYSHNELDVHHALAADRLRSLEKTKAQIKKEISVLRKSKPSKGIAHDKLITNIVKEVSRPRRKSKEVKPTGKSLGKRHKTVSFDEDADFDAVLDAASTGFVETVSSYIVLNKFYACNDVVKFLQMKKKKRKRSRRTNYTLLIC